MQLVVSATPGTGKSTITKDAEKYGLKHCHVQFNEHTREYELTVPAGPGVPVFDSDSSQFDKSEFPGNYIKHIKEVLKKFPDVVIFVSSHDNVREAMGEAGIKFVLCYPERELKGDYLERYEQRGSPEAFVKLMDEKWNDFIDSVQADKNAERKLVLSEGEFLVDVLKTEIAAIAAGHKFDERFPTAIISGTESIGDIVCDDVGQPVAAWGANGLEPLPVSEPVADVVVNEPVVATVVPEEVPAAAVIPDAVVTPDSGPVDFSSAIVTGTESIGDLVYNDVGVAVAKVGVDGLESIEIEVEIPADAIPAEVVVEVNNAPTEEPDAAMEPQDTPVAVTSLPEIYQAVEQTPVPANEGQPAADAPQVELNPEDGNVVVSTDIGAVVEVDPGGGTVEVTNDQGTVVVDPAITQEVAGQEGWIVPDEPVVDGNENLNPEEVAGQEGWIDPDAVPAVAGQEDLTSGSEAGAEVLPDPAPAVVQTELNKMDDVDLHQDQSKIGDDVGNAAKADEHPNVVVDGQEEFPPAEEIVVPEAIAALDRPTLVERVNTIDADISQLEAVKEVCEVGQVGGLESHQDGGELLTNAVANIKANYGVDIEPTVAGVEGFLDSLKTAVAAVGKALKGKPSAESKRLIKNKLSEASAGVKLYTSSEWQGKQEFINVGKAKFATPGIFKDASSVGDVETIFNLISKQVHAALKKHETNIAQRCSAGMKVFNELKGKDPEDKAAIAKLSSVEISPAALTGGVADSGLKNVDTKTATAELPVLNKEAIGKAAALMSKVIGEFQSTWKSIEAVEEKLLFEEDFYDSEFWDEHITSGGAGKVWNAVTYDTSHELNSIGYAYDAVLFDVAAFLERWILNSVK